MVLLLALIVFNSLELIRNAELTSQNALLGNSVEEMKEELNISKIVANLVGTRVKMTLVPVRPIRSLKNRSGSGQLVAFFSRKDCPICVEGETRELDKLQKEQPGRTIFAVCVDSNMSSVAKYMAQFKPTIDVCFERTTDYERYMGVRTPLVLLVDSSGVVECAHVSEPGATEERARFYRIARRLLSKDIRARKGKV